jgi:hypothetical protein
MQLNEVKFLENVRRIHLKPDEISIYATIADADVRVKLNDFVKYGRNPRFSAALDEICVNIVGRTMFKVLMTKTISSDMLKARGKIEIKEQDEKPKGSRFSFGEWAVKINSDFYELDGTGISNRRYYGISQNGKIRTKLKSMAGSMFHEFCHGLHHISGTKKKEKIICLDKTDLGNAWRDDEELRTICCVRDAVCGLMDPICDHCFDLMQSIMKGKRFLPRCSHNIGYRSGRAVEDAENREKLLQHFLKYKILLEGWREYVL